MAYVDQRNASNRPGAIAGVVAIHAAIGFILVTGLHTEVVKLVSTGPMPTKNIPIEPPPPSPKPPEKKVDPKPTQPKARDVIIPPAPIPIPKSGPTIDAGTIILPPSPPIPKVDPGIGTGLGTKPEPAPPAGLDPVSAKPRNDPSRWVTTNDYPSVSIREEQFGVTSFAVSVDAKGRVSDCRITGSSGHPRLDKATCNFVTRRARFTPARDNQGLKTTGSYSNSVSWVLPD